MSNTNPYPGPVAENPGPAKMDTENTAQNNVPAGAEELAQRGRAWFRHMEALAKAAQADLAKFLPQEAISPVVSEVAQIVKDIL